jgi:hypothetical protein
VTPAKSSPPKVLECPLFGGSDVSALVEPPEHRVILSWKASIIDSKHPKPYGYCVYRTTQPGNTQPTLRVNTYPVKQTTCTDDWVQNGSRYQYEVRAITQEEKYSGPSNVALAEIPFTKPKIHPEGLPQLCREAAGGP